MGWFVFIKENKNFQVIKEKKLCIKNKTISKFEILLRKRKTILG